MDSRLDFESERVSPGFFGEVDLGSKPGLERRTVTCYLPRSDPQCHGAKIEKEADQGKGDEEKAV